MLDGEKDTEAVAEIDCRPVRELESRGLRDWLLVVRPEIVVVDESERDSVPLTETLTVGEIDWLVVGDPVVDDDAVADGEEDDDAVWLTLGVVERVPDGEPVALGDGHTDAMRETVGEVDKERVPLGDNDVVGDCERDRVPLTVDVTLGVAVTDPDDVAHRLRLGVVVAERVMVDDALVLAVVVVKRVSDGDADCVGVVDAVVETDGMPDRENEDDEEKESVGVPDALNDALEVTVGVVDTVREADAETLDDAYSSSLLRPGNESPISRTLGGASSAATIDGAPASADVAAFVADGSASDDAAIGNALASVETSVMDVVGVDAAAAGAWSTARARYGGVVDATQSVNCSARRRRCMGAMRDGILTRADKPT